MPKVDENMLCEPDAKLCLHFAEVCLRAAEQEAPHPAYRAMLVKLANGWLNDAESELRRMQSTTAE